MATANVRRHDTDRPLYDRRAIRGPASLCGPPAAARNSELARACSTRWCTTQSMNTTVTTTNLPLGEPVRGKVRDCYRHRTTRFGDTLLIVSTDRISAFDWILPTPIPDKGKVLTAISAFWFDLLASREKSHPWPFPTWTTDGKAEVCHSRQSPHPAAPDMPQAELPHDITPIAHHLLTTDVDAMELPDTVDREPLRGRTMLVRRAEVIPFECVVRGSLAGSGLVEYQQHGTVCGAPLPPGLRPGDKLPQPIFTPATKAVSGHDENVSFEVMAAAIGAPLAAILRDTSIEVYRRGAEHAAAHGIVLADTKFEWGRLPDGSLILVDEVLTPDSSRFWPASATGQGRVPESFDKQFVRDWLERSGWDKASHPPALPADVVNGTREKYLEACRLITGRLPDGVS